MITMIDRNRNIGEHENQSPMIVQRCAVQELQAFNHGNFSDNQLHNHPRLNHNTNLAQDPVVEHYIKIDGAFRETEKTGAGAWEIVNAQGKLVASGCEIFLPHLPYKQKLWQLSAESSSSKEFGSSHVFPTNR
ncbi:OLC1v1036816C1 [Oldenlandia corymbosa var. corymbosa]|uniref:OLC1v1036816C1 n=1 Tax=Oldenlandia corymbosa var. corymbosa TaxID=529605 RepID=A0AAV1CWZ0_OLDCO|nr:OLC1v1036816C1 [Oldenlandia corymbosa var. corymbosa]